MRKKQDGDKNDKDAKKRNELFIGGIDQRGGGSGLAVVGPPPNRSSSSAARIGGSGGPPSVFDNIVGLASHQSEPPSETGSGSSKETTSRKISMYRNGFTVDDGEFRDLTSPENLAFIASLERGEVPRELQREQRAGEQRPLHVDILLADHREEDYVAPPPPPYIAFSGQGAVLRRDPADAVASEANIFSPELLLDVEISPVDESKPTTTVQVRTIQGKKIRIKINQDATVYQLAAMVMRDSGVGTAFSLSAGFPPVDVLDGSLSVKDAGLVGASITQK